MNSIERDTKICWQPNPEGIRSSSIASFVQYLRLNGASLPEADEPSAFQALHQWSIDNREAFWSSVWDHLGVIGDRGGERVALGIDKMQPPSPAGPRWFPQARLNFAENLLCHDGPEEAIVFWDERGAVTSLSRQQLRQQVAALAAAFRKLGVRPGDRVAGWLPNIPEAVVAMLATANLGAIWTSCSPDFGVEGIIDRFGQTEPKLLLYADGYRYAGKVHDCTARVSELLDRLDTVEHAVEIHYLGTESVDNPKVLAWNQLLAANESATLEFERFPFDQPLYILYSSGTTGLPKCLVHGAGGTLLQHLKEHKLHVDLRESEPLFYFTTCGWMMWNWLVTALASGNPIVLYDGAPMPADEPDLLWRMADEVRVAVFGTSAKYLALSEKNGINPTAGRKLSALRAVLSTGSPLGADSFDWCSRVFGPRVQLASISGGTDIVSCFVLGNPLQSVHRGEIQGPGLGMAVEVFEAGGGIGDRGDGCAVTVGEAGELVCTLPFPSMPVCFWNDPTAARYRAAYFDSWPGVWRHGDWATKTPSGGFIITGRSDATLNPGGVRIGTAEVYRQVESIDEVIESLVIGQRIPGADDGDVRVVLFVRLRQGSTLSDELRERIRTKIRVGASPHHVPRAVLAVSDIPRTRSGKLSELAVRDVVEGRGVQNIGALANPESLDQFRDRAELQE